LLVIIIESARTELVHLLNTLYLGFYYHQWPLFQPLIALLALQVMAEIHQLNDLGDAKEEVNDLPICVKEILSDGPGLVLRTYRVEISANNGVMMGSADIQDNEIDLARVIGEKYLSQYLPAERKMWKLGSIFEHVVRERVILDMLMGRKPKDNAHGHNKDGRREGVMQAHDELADLTGTSFEFLFFCG